MKPFIVFPDAKRETKLLNEEFKAKCVVASSSNGWMNEELTLDWVRSVLRKFPFVQVPRDEHSQTRTTHVKDRSFNRPTGLYEIHSSARAPARREIVKWILAAWNGLDKTMIINSFKSCALTVAVDGLDDGRIHCFKENQPCRAGLQRLKVVQQAMSNSRDKDPFDGITESDVEDAAPDSLIIDVSDIEVIDIEYGR